MWILANYVDLHYRILSDALIYSNDYRNNCEHAPSWIIWAEEDTDKPNWIIWPNYLAWGGHNTWLSSLNPDIFVLTGNLFTGFWYMYT